MSILTLFKQNSTSINSPPGKHVSSKCGDNTFRAPVLQNHLIDNLPIILCNFGTISEKISQKPKTNLYSPHQAYYIGR
jgi:hypothetical protein